MTDEKPKSATHEEIAAAVRAEIGRLVPGAPLPAEAAPAPSTSKARCGTPRMADNGSSGQWLALKSQVDDLKGNYAEIKHDMDSSFASLRGEMAEQARTTNERLDTIVTAIGNKGNGDVTKYAGIFAVIVAIASGVIGGFIKLENDSIGDKITQQGTALTDKITQQGASVNALIASNETAAAKDSARHDRDIEALQNTTIPRAELDRRIDRNTNEIMGVVKTQTDHSQEIASIQAEARDLKADVERLKGDVVKREENVGHWDDYNNRLNLLSSRIVELTRDLGGSNPSAQIKDLRDQFNELQRRFINIPGMK